jgi:MoxR-like ATPase
MTEFDNNNIPENEPDNNFENTMPQFPVTPAVPEQESEDITFGTRTDLSELQRSIDAVKQQLNTVIVGQHKMIDQLLVAILSNGHVLLEGVPGVAKTITAKLLSKTLSLDFSRIQFTPDLMPSDILGTSVFDLSKSEFTFKKGPIFSHFVLIDEINRAPAKTQAALFEVMEERRRGCYLYYGSTVPGYCHSKPH